MSERTSKRPGIADYVAARRKHKDCFLDEIDRLIDWKPLEKVLRQKLKRVANAVGNPAYSSQLNRYVLQVRGLSDGIMHKAVRNRELTLAERATNRQVSSVRSKVERAFGTLKRGYGFFRARYLGLAKVELEFLLNAMAFNLKKAVLKVAC